LKKLSLEKSIKPGQRVAITGGSRGIANIAEILKVTIDFLKSLGVQPFIFPAMGSHGGATGEGQVGLLSHYGITESRCGFHRFFWISELERPGQGSGLY
jgi:hypothetical protein